MNKNIFSITLDCDWAPDFILECVAELLIKKNVKTTWFITNYTPLIEKLKSNPLFEIGIHPNFDINSTQGKHIESILKNLKKIVPDAKSIRTHNLTQSTPLLSNFSKYGIENDVSLLLFKTANLYPHYIHLLKLYRFPFFWEDDVEMSEKTKWIDLDFYKKINGLKIFDFHPIHIFLNSKNMNAYNLLKQKTKLQNLTFGIVKKYINEKEYGVKTFFIELINFLENQSTYKIHELREIYF